jgi:hypothetical protein
MKERYARPGRLHRWIEERKKHATMQVFEATLEEIKPWDITDGRLANLDKEGQPRFFEIEGVKIANSGREVDAFGQPGIFEVADPSDPSGACGTVALLVDKSTGDILVTVAAEPFQADPGSKPGEHLSGRPSVQGSFSNLTENKVPHSDQIKPREYDVFTSSNPGRIRGKIRVGYTYVNKKSVDLNKTPNSAWFSQKEIKRGINESVPFNALFYTAYEVYRADAHRSTRIKQLFGRMMRPMRNKNLALA